MYRYSTREYNTVEYIQYVLKTLAPLITDDMIHEPRLHRSLAYSRRDGFSYRHRHRAKRAEGPRYRKIVLLSFAAIVAGMVTDSRNAGPFRAPRRPHD